MSPQDLVARLLGNANEQEDIARKLLAGVPVVDLDGEAIPEYAQATPLLMGAAIAYAVAKLIERLAQLGISEPPTLLSGSLLFSLKEGCHDPDCGHQEDGPHDALTQITFSVVPDGTQPMSFNQSGPQELVHYLYASFKGAERYLQPKTPEEEERLRAEALDRFLSELGISFSDEDLDDLN